MFRRHFIGLTLLVAAAAPVWAQERLGVRLWADIEVVGILRITGDGLLLDTEEENRGLGSDRIVLKRSTWQLFYTAPGDAKVGERLRLLNGKKVLASGKGLLIPETAYFLGVPVQTIRMECALRNPVLTEVK